MNKILSLIFTVVYNALSFVSPFAETKVDYVLGFWAQSHGVDIRDIGKQII